MLNILIFQKIYTMKKLLFLLSVIVVVSLKSQGKVGVNTSTPTEVSDINGTLRVRSLPNNGTANAIYTTGTNTNSGTTPTQTFNAVNTVVLDANGVLGTYPGLPKISNTYTRLAPSGGFPFGETAATTVQKLTVGSLSAAFYQGGGTNNNQFWFSISSPLAGRYIVDERRMTTGGSTWAQTNGTLVANTWTRINIGNYALGTSWHVHVYLASVDKVYRITLVSFGSNPTVVGDQLTFNIQEL